MGLKTSNPLSSHKVKIEIRKLNMLRGLAAMIVLIAHFSNNTEFLDRLLGKGLDNLVL